MIDTFITPTAGWQPPSIQMAVKPVPARSPSKPKSPARHWADDAFHENWEEAVVGFLGERRREAVPYWQVVNSVVMESCQPTRGEVRLATKRALEGYVVLSDPDGTGNASFRATLAGG